ncbi:MAG: serine hydrolase domain-containing protein [Ilumatobacteraceae bacterium]
MLPWPESHEPYLSDEAVAEINRFDDEQGFAGVVAVDEERERSSGGGTLHGGLADRAHSVPIRPDTRFGIASGSKGFTAVTVVSLIVDGVLALDTPARALLGDDLPLIDDAVTIEHLLAHRSGIGDYLDEDAGGEITDHVMPVPVHRLATTEGFLAVLGGFPQVFTPGERFAYNNGGYVVLALLAERAAGMPFHDLVQQRVFDPIAMTGAAYLRNDELPGDVAIGYLFADGLRTNALHLPVRGSGDGGAQVRLSDVANFWAAFFRGALVPPEWVAAMTTPRSTTASGRMHYGLGFWLRRDGAAQLEGYDAGVSFRSVHHPDRRRTCTVVSNWSEGAWPVCEILDRYGW